MLLGSVVGSFCLCMVLVCLGDRFGIVLGWSWDRFGIVLGLFWDGFRIVFGSVRDRLGCVRGVFGHVLRMFWYGFGMVLPKCKLSQRDPN